jgi:hypothetical protein
MTAKRLMTLIALAILATGTGCRSWCEHHYPCAQPVCAQPCAPCCPPGTAAGYAPTGTATPVSNQTWGAPRGNCTCTCQ